MEPLWKLIYLLEPASVTLIFTAVIVTFGSALRALNYGKEMERNRDFPEASITLDRSQALMIPLASSCSLVDVLSFLINVASGHCFHSCCFSFFAFLLPHPLCYACKITVWVYRSICFEVLFEIFYQNPRDFVAG